MRILCASLLILALAARLSAADCSTKTITCGGQVTGTIVGDTCIVDFFPTQRYNFTGKAGQLVTATTSSLNGYESQTAIVDAAGNQLGYGCCDDPSFAKATLPSNGTYSVLVSFGNPHTSGNFNLSLSCQDGSSGGGTGTCTSSGTLTMDHITTGTLSSSDTACSSSPTAYYQKKYTLEVNAGDVFKIAYDTKTYPPYLEIDGPDHSGGFKYAMLTSDTHVDLTYIAPTTGTVTVWVAEATTTATSGTFILDVEKLSEFPCRTRAVRH